MARSAKVLMRVCAEQSSGDVQWTPLLQKALTLIEGTGVGQIDRIHVAEYTIASGANADLDLAGGVTDKLGNTITFAELVAVAILSEAEDGTANTTNVTVGGGTNPFVGFWGTSGDQIVLTPGRMMLVAGDSAAGIGAVVASTGDILRLANAAGATAKVQVAILGRSA